jgi:Flp pilus assembly protein TadG
MKRPLGEQLRRMRQKGSALLEASLVLMLFLTLMLSLFDFGIALFRYQSIVHEARAGARYGAVNPNDLTAIKNMVLYNRTTGSGTGYMGLSPSSVTVARNGTSGGPDDRIVVTVSGFNFTLLTPGFAGTKTGKTIAVTIPVEN